MSNETESDWLIAYEPTERKCANCRYYSGIECRWKPDPIRKVEDDWCGQFEETFERASARKHAEFRIGLERQKRAFGGGFRG